MVQPANLHPVLVGQPVEVADLHALGERLGPGEGRHVVAVHRNDEITVAQAESLDFTHLVISPGPGEPTAAGVSMDMIRGFAGRVPILGVCLGHQCIGAAFGGTVDRAPRLMHGKTSSVTADGQTIFKGIKSPFSAMRYHSLAVEKETLPECLKVTAETEDGEIMGIRHVTDATEGIQFHPESIMTPVGKRLLRNFVNQA